MEKTYTFTENNLTLTVSVPMEKGGVVTSKYCPQELLTGGISLVKAINGETEEEFLADCQKQMMAMGVAGKEETVLDRHIGGLIAVVMDHISRCGRIIFGDLLIYMDCFCLLLEADGFSEEEIKEIYPRITRTIVDLYPEYIKNTLDLSAFQGSNFDFLLQNLVKN